MLFICYFFPLLQPVFAKHKQPTAAAGAEATFSIPNGCRGGMDVARRAVGWGSDGTGVTRDQGDTDQGEMGLGRACDKAAGTTLINTGM